MVRAEEVTAAVAAGRRPEAASSSSAGSAERRTKEADGSWEARGASIARRYLACGIRCCLPHGRDATTIPTRLSTTPAGSGEHTSCSNARGVAAAGCKNWCNVYTCSFHSSCDGCDVCAELDAGAHCAGWCSEYACGLTSYCEGCDACAVLDAGEHCAGWCNAYTCSFHDACSTCDICEELDSGSYCATWCNSWVCGYSEYCEGCDYCAPSETESAPAPKREEPSVVFSPPSFLPSLGGGRPAKLLELDSLYCLPDDGMLIMSEQQVLDLSQEACDKPNAGATLRDDTAIQLCELLALDA